MSAPTTTIERVCVFCMTTHRIELDAGKAERWQAGGMAQDVWPEMPAPERELLVSGTCPECWDRYMKDPDEQGDE